MDLQHKSSTPLRAKDVFLLNKNISLFYSLFVFLLYYKIIGLSSLNLAGRGLAGRGLTHLWPAGMGRAWNLRAGPGRAGPGPNIHGLDRAWAGPGPTF